MLTAALQGAPLDMADAWSQALRYAAAGLAAAQKGLQQLFELITGLSTPGELAVRDSVSCITSWQGMLVAVSDL